MCEIIHFQWRVGNVFFNAHQIVLRITFVFCNQSSHITKVRISEGSLWLNTMINSVCTLYVLQCQTWHVHHGVHLCKNRSTWIEVSKSCVMNEDQLG